jgi:hypothetical protein
LNGKISPLSRAKLLESQGRLEEAKAAYLELLKLDQGQLEALGRMGALLHETGYRSAAITVYRRLLELCPGDAAAHVNLANVLWDHDDHAGARSHYEKALEIDPGCAQAHQGMAAALMELRQDEAAWEHGKKGFAGRAWQQIPYRGNGKPVQVLVLNSVAGGNIPLRQAIDNKIFAVTMLATEFHDPSLPLPEHQLVFNAIGEADRSRYALRLAAALLKQTRAQVVNPPEIVARSSRAENASRLAGIKGLRIPKIMSFSKGYLGRADAATQLQSQGFEFPLLLRAQGFHAGKHFEKIEGPEGLAAALAAMPGQEFSVIQFFDAKNADGKYRKYRVMMVGGRLYPLHAAVSQNWKIHYFSADMANNASHRAEDQAFLAGMPGLLGPAAMAALEALREALGLDYGGVDFGLNAQGEVLFFEANATMVILRPADGEKWAYRREPVRRVLDAVTAMLLSKAQAGPLAV